MAYVVCEPCIGTKDRSCVEVCPVDCFYNIREKKFNDEVNKPAAVIESGGKGDNDNTDSDADGKKRDYGMLMIHADECINCGACETECPVEAIYEDSSVPEKWQKYVKINADVTLAMSDEQLDKSRCTAK